MIPFRILRNTLAIALGLVSLGMIAFALFVRPELVEQEPLYRNRDNRSSRQQKEIRFSPGYPEKQKTMEKPAALDDSISAAPEKDTQETNHSQEEYPASFYEINGSQTLQYVAEKYGIDVAKLASDLKIPVSLSGEKLGRLKRQYPFTMDDVRESILKNKK